MSNRIYAIIRLVVKANCQSGVSLEGFISFAFFALDEWLAVMHTYIVEASLSLSVYLFSLCVHLVYLLNSSGSKFNGKSFATQVPNREMHKRNRLASSTGSVNSNSKLYCLPFRWTWLVRRIHSSPSNEDSKHWTTTSSFYRWHTTFKTIRTYTLLTLRY